MKILLSYLNPVFKIVEQNYSFLPDFILNGLSRLFKVHENRASENDTKQDTNYDREEKIYTYTYTVEQSCKS